MQRRTFLKVIAALTGAAASPAIATQVVEAFEAPAAAQLGLIRELAAYDIHEDLWLVRYDIFCKEQELQLGVDMRFYREHVKEQLPKHREIAKQVLENELKHRGLSWSDLTPLPVPDAYRVPADWAVHA